ncbi:MAG: hypothetical protein JWP63_2528 [Candidatus Solibacter sp.]|nr:hypothetical protein [Candidatus Solibacter sp.]
MEKFRLAPVIAAGLAAASILLFGADPKAPDTSKALFDASKVWTVHLTFTAEQWEAMEPKGGMGGPGGPGGFGRGGGRGMGGPGFGPGGMAMAIAPAFLKGDRDGDGKLSREEFRALGAVWFNAWDTEKQGKVNEEQLRAGLGSSMSMPGGPGGPGGGGPRGRGPGGGMLGQNGRNGMSAMMGIDFEYVHAGIDFNGTVYKDVAVRYKGNSTFQQSRGSLKRSLKLDLNKYVKGQKVGGVSKLNLHSNVTDAGEMNEPLSYRLFRDGGVPSPRTSYARVYLTVAGKYGREYVGLYSVVEDIDNTFAQDRFATKDGAIFKPSTGSLFGYLGDDWAKYKQTYDPKTELSEKQQKRVIEFAKLVTSGSDAEFAAQLGAYIDVDEWARYHSLNVWLANMDSILAMGQNFYLYLNPTTDKFSILPWDLDLSFGGMGGGTELSIEHPWRGQNRFLERLFQVDTFKQRYMARMKEFSASICRPERITAQVEETAAVIRPAVKEESDAKVARFDQTVAGEAVARGGGRGGPGGAPIMAFVGARAKSVAAQLAGESKGSEGGGFGGRGGGPGVNEIAGVMLRAMDLDKDGAVSREEFARGFAKWFEDWGGAIGWLTEEQIRAGVTRVWVSGR